MSRAGDASKQSAVVDPEASAARTMRPRRNIVLLSDGTGNSAAKLARTNVWELYQALDLGDDDQLAIYDDGVGTSGFRPLQLLGGAFGWGLSRNVRDLYEFLCRHYRPGDHIYVFGFSRGAFTARTLAGLVCKCGILDPSRTVPRLRLLPPGYEHVQLNTHAGLKAGVRLAYRSYRRGYDKAPFARLYRRLRDLFLRDIPMPGAFRDQYSLREPVTIKFVGVWDTVDAVGLPVDELSTMIDRVFYPHRFPDQNLSRQVERACHAIAVDDERYTFHPVLWNEDGEDDSGRIKQVWFPGMHSDVGGGYPDDDLARVSLCWMISQVSFAKSRGEGLRFDPVRLREIEQRAQSLGKMHDSRRGLGVYYRYRPRHVASLCHDPDSGVAIAEPKIHHSVLKRIANNTAGYAPAGLPTSYRVVDANGAISDLDPADYETGSQRQLRAQLLERAQDHVFWRRVLYFMFVFVTLALLFMPYYRPPLPGAVPDGVAETALAKALGWLPALLPGSLGGWAGYWTGAWAQSPYWFGSLAVIYGWLLWHSRAIDAKIRRLSEAAWWHVKQPPGSKPDVPAVGPFEWLAKRWRRSGPLRRFHRASVRWGVPILAAVLGVFLIGGAAYRVAVHLPLIGDGVCKGWSVALDQGGLARPVLRQALDGPVAIAFDTRVPCVDTGVDLQAGQRYVIEMTNGNGKVLTAKDWEDARYVAGPSGLAGVGYLGNPVYFGLLPARRHLTLPWFTLIAEIRRDSGQVFPLTRPTRTWIAPHSGRLFLYVNDAINRWFEIPDLNSAEADGLPITPAERQSGRSSAWYANYLNNDGVATITIRRDD